MSELLRYNTVGINDTLKRRNALETLKKLFRNQFRREIRVSSVKSETQPLYARITPSFSQE